MFISLPIIIGIRYYVFATVSDWIIYI